MKGRIFDSEHSRAVVPFVIIIFSRLVYYTVSNTCDATNTLLKDCLHLIILLLTSLLYLYVFKRKTRAENSAELKHPYYVFFIAVLSGILINALLKAMFIGDSNTAYYTVLSYEKIVLSCLLFPIAEELVFRHIMLHDFSAFGIKISIVMSALLFAFGHGISDWLYSFLLGIALGYVYLARNLLYSILFHAAHNVFLIISGFVRNHADAFQYRMYSIVCVLTIFIISVRGLHVIFRGWNEKKS